MIFRKLTLGVDWQQIGVAYGPIHLQFLHFITCVQSPRSVFLLLLQFDDHFSLPIVHNSNQPRDRGDLLTDFTNFTMSTQRDLTPSHTPFPPFDRSQNESFSVIPFYRLPHYSPGCTNLHLSFCPPILPSSIPSSLLHSRIVQVNGHVMFAISEFSRIYPVDLLLNGMQMCPPHYQSLSPFPIPVCPQLPPSLHSSSISIDDLICPPLWPSTLCSPPPSLPSPILPSQVFLLPYPTCHSFYPFLRPFQPLMHTQSAGPPLSLRFQTLYRIGSQPLTDFSLRDSNNK